jgi:gamma-glutamyltranspeptidase/glutathione hydrolase
LAVTVLCALTACGGDSSFEHPAYAPGQIAQSPHGMVVSGAPLATDAGVAVLEAGGNAIDAAVATAFALSVVEPTMSGLGGRTQLLIRTADGTFDAIDGTTQVPANPPSSREIRDEGYPTIAVPGTVAALTLAQRRHGRLALADVLAPAITLAEDGFLLPDPEAARLAAIAERLAAYEGTRRSFLDADGSALAAGARLVQPDLARVLRAIAREGSDVFYRGWIADSIAADMARNGGAVTRADLAAYEALPNRVVRGDYRDVELVGTYLPASGATVIEALNILERFDLRGRAGSAEWIALTARALLASFEDRVRELDDPAAHAALLVSDDWAAIRAREIGGPAAPGVAATAPDDREPEHTTHLTVADGDGAIVALTQSLGPTMGSRVVTPGLGFVYAATLGYLADVPPGGRPFSSQAPLVVLDGDIPVLALGGAGARRILSAVVEIVSRVVDGPRDLVDAVAAPRFHPTPDTVYVEEREHAAWPDTVLAGLSDLGYAVALRSSAPYFARIHGIAYDRATRVWIGVADPRWNGAANAPERPHR